MMLKVRGPISSLRIGSLRRISNLVQKNPGSITLEDIEGSSIVTNDDNDITNDRLNLIKTVNHSENLNKQQLNQYLIPNFSFYFKLPQDIINSDILYRLIDINPGRVHSSIDLFNKYEAQIGTPDETLLSMLIDKLLQGEIYEVKDVNEEGGIYIPSQENINHLFQLMAKYDINESALKSILDKIGNHPHLSSILDYIVKENLTSLESLVQYINVESNINKNSYLELLNIIFQNEPELLNIKQVVDILELTKQSTDSVDEQPVEQEGSKDQQSQRIDKKQFSQQVLKYVEEHELDMAETSLLLRIELVENYGIYQNNLDKATKLFHKYQSHAKFGIGMVQYQLFKSYCYQAVNEEKEIYLKIGETLVNPEELNIRTIQALMIAQSQFDTEIALKYYNDYIGQVSKEVNSITKRSSSGYLTETLILVNLYDNDRNFATLVFDKAIDNKIISDEFEISQIKQLFKYYGQSFKENDDWSTAKPIFKQHVLDYLKKL